MTSKLDRIQENANKYIVKNCPAQPIIWNDNWCNKEQQFCQNCADCVIKQVIELCKEYDKEQAEWCEPIPFGTDNIYDLFDSEEINE